MPFTSSHRPRFVFGVTDVTGAILVDDGAVVSPGDQAEIGFALNKPVGIEPSVCFATCECGKTVSARMVTTVCGWVKVPS